MATHPCWRQGWVRPPAPAQSPSNASSLGPGGQSSWRTGSHGQPWAGEGEGSVEQKYEKTKCISLNFRQENIGSSPRPAAICFLRKQSLNFSIFSPHTNEIMYWLWVLLEDRPQSCFISSLSLSVFISSTKLGCPYGWGL